LLNSSSNQFLTVEGNFRFAGGTTGTRILRQRYDFRMAKTRKPLSRIGLGTLVATGLLGAVLWNIAERLHFTPQSGCPILAWIAPLDRPDILPTDYIEMTSMAIGPRASEPVHVRIYGSGLVERETVATIGGYTVGCPLHDSDKTLHVSSATAQVLLVRARDAGFCRLCTSYQNMGVMDGGITEVRLSLHGKLKTVSDHNGDPPPVFSELVGHVWEISGIESVANFRKFSPEREAECRRIEEGRIHP
jgi:hypothetical protein